MILVPDTGQHSLSNCIYFTGTVSETVWYYEHHSSSSLCFCSSRFFSYSGVTNDSSAIFVKVRQYGWMGAAISAATCPQHTGSTESHSCSVRKSFPTCSQVLEHYIFYQNDTKQGKCLRLCILASRHEISLPILLWQCGTRRRTKYGLVPLCVCVCPSLSLSMSMYPFV